VDDSSAARKRVVRALRERGLPSEEAENGHEALERLRRSAFSAVWLDLEMPRMDGFELLEALQREPAVSSAPVVIVSSRCDSATRERAAQLGAAEFLAKPATDQDVDRVLEALDVSNCGRK
jgi:CheY-like chemotaxis protein